MWAEVNAGFLANAHRGHKYTMYIGTTTAPTSRSATAKFMRSMLVRMRLSLELLRNTAMESELPMIVSNERQL